MGKGRPFGVNATLTPPLVSTWLRSPGTRLGNGSKDSTMSKAASRDDTDDGSGSGSAAADILGNRGVNEEKLLTMSRFQKL